MCGWRANHVMHWFPQDVCVQPSGRLFMDEQVAPSLTAHFVWTLISQRLTSAGRQRVEFLCVLKKLHCDLSLRKLSNGDVKLLWHDALVVSQFTEKSRVSPATSWNVWNRNYITCPPSWWLLVRIVSSLHHPAQAVQTQEIKLCSD